MNTRHKQTTKTQNMSTTNEHNTYRKHMHDTLKDIILIKHMRASKTQISH